MYSVVVASMMMLYICFAAESTTAAESGYIVTEFPEIPCNDPSTAISTCSNSLDYKIPDFKNYPQIPDFSDFRKQIVALGVLAFTLLGDEKCTKAGTKYLCEAAYPFRCGDEYVEVDGKEIADTCSEAKKDCSSLNATMQATLFNCSAVLSDPTLQAKLPRKLMCSAFPVLNNDPYSCEANYKVFDGNAIELKMAGERIVFAHEMLKNSSLSDPECEKNVADMMCKALLPACSIDRTKLVSFFSRQGCRQIVGCVNQTNDANLIQGTHGMCDQLPDGKNATKYSLEYVYDNKAANHALAFSTVLFIASLVGQSFF